MNGDFDPTRLVGVLVPLAFVVLGGLFLVLGVRQVFLVQHRKRHWLRYRGEVYDFVWSNRGNNPSRYWMLRWIDNGNVERTAKNPYGISGGGVQEPPFGVDILVDPEDPRKAQVADGAQSGTMVSVIIAVVGGLFAVIGLVSLTAGRLLVH